MDLAIPKSEVSLVSRYENEFLITLYREMVSIREFEEQVQDLYNRTLIPGIAHLSCGQEAVPVGVCAACVMRLHYRTIESHSPHLARADPGRMFAELFGKVDGYCRKAAHAMCQSRCR
jgi:pyruvate dehydrogenase E1 component alpha subunit